MSEIRIYAPLHTLGLDRKGIQTHLYSGVSHISDIIVVTAISKRQRHIEEKQHIGSLPVEIL